MNVQRGILGVGVVIATGFALQTGALFGVLGAPIANTSDGRSYDTSKFGLELEGFFAGWLRNLDDGGLAGEVVNEKIGAYHVIKKHIAGVKYEDFSFQIGLNESKALYTWIRATMNGEYTRRNGAFKVVTYDYNEVRRVNFMNALITEVDFPALDASSKDAGYLTVKATPEEMRWVQGTGTAVPNPPTSKVAKTWVLSQFRISIDGVDTSRVTKADAIQFKQSVIDAAIGTTRDPVKMPTQMAISSLKITIPQNDQAPFLAWAQKYNAPGGAASNTKNGTISYMDNTMQHEMLRLELSGLAPVKITTDAMSANGDQIHRVTVEIAIGKLLLTPAPGTTFD